MKLVQVFQPQPHRLFGLSTSEQTSASIVETRQALAEYYEDEDRMFSEKALDLANNRLLRGYFSVALSNELEFELVAEVMHELELLDDCFNIHREHKCGVATTGRAMKECGVQWTMRKHELMKECVTSIWNCCKVLSYCNYVLGVLLKQIYDGKDVLALRGGKFECDSYLI